MGIWTDKICKMKRAKLIKKIQTSARWGLCAWICVGIYKETGIYTLIFALLLFIYTEIMQLYLNKKFSKTDDKHEV